MILNRLSWSISRNSSNNKSQFLITTVSHRLFASSERTANREGHIGIAIVFPGYEKVSDFPVREVEGENADGEQEKLGL